MLWVIPPRRGVGRPATKLEEPDYCMISVWEKRITTVTAIPVLFGDGMSNLTGRVAPIDHAADGHVKSVQNVDNVHIKVNYDPVTNPLLVCGAACRVGRARASSMRYDALSRCSSQCPGGILVSQWPAPQRAMDLVGSIVYVI
jgi:hypothetical protein